MHTLPERMRRKGFNAYRSVMIFFICGRRSPRPWRCSGARDGMMVGGKLGREAITLYRERGFTDVMTAIPANEIADVRQRIENVLSVPGLAEDPRPDLVAGR